MFGSKSRLHIDPNAEKTYATLQGFHNPRVTWPWDMKPVIIDSMKTTAVREESIKPIKLRENVDRVEEEKVSRNQWGERKLPEEVHHRKMAPQDTWEAGTYQSGTDLINKIQELRTRSGMEADSRDEVDGQPQIFMTEYRNFD